MSLGRLAQQTGSAGEIRRSGFTVDNMSHPADSRDEVEQNFADSVLKLRAASTPDSPGGQDLPGAIRPGSALTGERCLELFDAQLASRHLDLAARWLRKRKAGFYTIGSSGHEGNAAVAAALRADRPGAAALPVRARSTWRAPPAPARPGRCARRAARAGRGGGRADLRRAAQGDRPRRPAHHPADLDHRLPSAARGRARLRAGPRRPAGRRQPLARRRDRGGQPG